MTSPVDIFDDDFELADRDQDLVRLYVQAGLSVDHLAYTKEFDTLYKRFQDQGHKQNKAQVFRRLLQLRKAGLLPRVSTSTVAASS